MAKLKETTVAGDLGIEGDITASGDVNITGSVSASGGLNAGQLKIGTVPEDRLLTATTSRKGIVQLSTSTSGTSTEKAVTESALKAVNDTATSKEPIIAKNTAFNKNFETSSDAYLVAGTASAGTSANVARSNHRHPAQTSVTGNAGTASKWANSRTVTLTGDVSGSFSIDGSSNVSTSISVNDNSHKHSHLLSDNGYTAYIVKEYPEGDTSVSASKSTNGNAGNLYLGYNSESQKTFTSNIILGAPIKWNYVGGHTIIDSNGRMPWSNLVNVPSTFAPSAHTHDDRYYTESESNARFLRKDGDDEFSYKISASASDKSSGIYGGNHSQQRISHIWGIGTNYTISSDGSNFGDFYGAAYIYQNHPLGGNMSRGHQMVWVQEGRATSSIGTDLWTSGMVLANSGGRIASWSLESQDLKVHGKRALVGETNGRLTLGYGGDFSSLHFSNYTVYHTGNKPRPADIGAAAMSGGRTIFSQTSRPNANAVGDIWVTW